MGKFSFHDMESVCGRISQDYRIFAPVRKVNKGRFSDTDLITYDYVKSFAEIEFFEKSYYSAKEILFPVRQSLFETRKGKFIEVEKNFPDTIVFSRPCDIHAIGITDSHFLRGDFKDTYYERRRQKLKFFLIECAVPFESCFCVSLGTNRTEDYAGFMRRAEDGFEVKVKDADLREYFAGGMDLDVEPRFVEKDSNPISLPEEIDTSIFKNEIWQEYSRRCTGCGRCNSVCPTCACFTLQDVLPEGEEDAGARKRIWSSCQVKKFASLAGNHDFRIPQGDRMRYKVLHKIRDFRKKAGVNMCVGCGRCDNACPDYISMFKCIEKINAVIREKGKDG